MNGMQGNLPMTPELVAAISNLMAQRRGGNPSLAGVPEKESVYGGMPVEDVSPVAATGMQLKPHTQNKVPNDVMQKILKARIYELSPDSGMDAGDINNLDTALYR